MFDVNQIQIYDPSTGKTAGVSLRRELLVGVDQTIKQLAYDASNNLEYMGFATIGSATSGALWRIIKLAYDASNNLTGITYAGGDDLYDNIWDNHAALSYS